MTAEEVLSIHTDTFNRALKEQDYAALEGLYASDYMLVRPDGSVLNKQEVGKMTPKEWGKLLQIHVDYHLRQVAA